jgi:hypothetical protein
LQIACVKWFRLQYAKYADYLWAVPNGGKRPGKTGPILTAEGVLSGVSDLVLSLPSTVYHGLFIEMKSDKGKVSPSQAAFLERQKAVGYQTAVCYTFDEFMEVINNYMASIVKGQNREWLIANIPAVVCSHYGINPEQIFLPGRGCEEIVESRQICITIHRRKLGGSLAVIGMKYGGKGHATVLHSTRRFDELWETDPQFNARIRKIATELSIDIKDIVRK